MAEVMRVEIKTPSPMITSSERALVVRRLGELRMDE